MFVDVFITIYWPEKLQPLKISLDCLHEKRDVQFIYINSIRYKASSAINQISIKKVCEL